MEISVNGNRSLADERSPMWSLVVQGSGDGCFELFGETIAAQQARHEGRMDSKAVQFVYEFDLEESRLINKLRANEDDFRILSKILNIVQNEFLAWNQVRQSDESFEKLPQSVHGGL